MLRSCLVLCLCLPAAAAQETKVRKIVLHPAPAPAPALRYRLLPEVRDLKPGNAALLYQRAHTPEWFATLKKTLLQNIDFVDSDLPLEKFPVAQADKVLANRAILAEIDLAARRAHCDW